MLVLEPGQVKHIENKIASVGLKNNSLGIDLMDHVCCMIEERLALGAEFQQAEKEVFREMGVLQMQAIEQETELLTQNKTTMKKRTKIIGLVSVALLATGFAFKMLHIMGAGIIWGAGVLTLVFGFVLFLTLDRFSYEKSPSRRVNGLIGFLGSGSVLLGFGLKLLHWPIANHAIAVGAAILFVYFVINNSQARNGEISK